MGQTAENVAEKWQISREMQDSFAVASQIKPKLRKKLANSKMKSLLSLSKNRKGDIIVDQDEYIRYGATMEAMQKLRPAFVKDGSVTAANASGLNDGAAGALLMSVETPSHGVSRQWRASRLLRRRSRPIDYGRRPDLCLTQSP